MSNSREHVSNYIQFRKYVKKFFLYCLNVSLFFFGCMKCSGSSEKLVYFGNDFVSSICCLKWSHWSQKFRRYKTARVPCGFLRRWSPACPCATAPCGSRRRPAACSTRPFSSATSCRQVQLHPTSHSGELEQQHTDCDGDIEFHTSVHSSALYYHWQFPH